MDPTDRRNSGHIRVAQRDKDEAASTNETAVARAKWRDTKNGIKVSVSIRAGVRVRIH
jgi:hypothetical protein